MKLRFVDGVCVLFNKTRLWNVITFRVKIWG